MVNKKEKMSTRTMVLMGILTALVVVLQSLAVFLRVVFGIFAPSLVLIPIVIGTATCGKKAGAWLGFVFSIMVFATGDANAFLAVNVPGTIITVIAKGVACGFVSGIVYSALSKHNDGVAVAASAIVCPVVNTGVFLIGCYLFFMDTVTQWAGGTNVGEYILVGLVGTNFLFELGLNVVLSPVIMRILKARKNL